MAKGLAAPSEEKCPSFSNYSPSWVLKLDTHFLVETEQRDYSMWLNRRDRTLLKVRTVPRKLSLCYYGIAAAFPCLCLHLPVLMLLTLGEASRKPMARCPVYTPFTKEVTAVTRGYSWDSDLALIQLPYHLGQEIYNLGSVSSCWKIIKKQFPPHRIVRISEKAGNKLVW